MRNSFEICKTKRTRQLSFLYFSVQLRNCSNFPTQKLNSKIPIDKFGQTDFSTKRETLVKPSTSPPEFSRAFLFLPFLSSTPSTGAISRGREATRSGDVGREPLSQQDFVRKLLSLGPRVNRAVGRVHLFVTWPAWTWTSLTHLRPNHRHQRIFAIPSWDRSIFPPTPPTRVRNRLPFR